MLFTQNLTPKREFVQKSTCKFDRILEKNMYFLKIDVYDTLNTISEFPFYPQNTTLILCFHWRMQDSILLACYGVLMVKLDPNYSQIQADFTVFALDPQGAHALFAPPGYAAGFLGHACFNILIIKCSLGVDL